MAQCPRHPGSPATDMCVECGELVCGQCAYVTADRRVFCPSCQGKAQQSAPSEVSLEALLGVEKTPSEPQPLRTVPVEAPRPKPRPAPARNWSPSVVPFEKPATKNSAAAIWSLILPVLCCGWGAVVGMVLAVRERNLLKEGRSTSSPGLVTASIVLNALGLGWSALMLLASLLGK